MPGAWDVRRVATDQMADTAGTLGVPAGGHWRSGYRPWPVRHGGVLDGNRVRSKAGRHQREVAPSGVGRLPMTPTSRRVDGRRDARWWDRHARGPARDAPAHPIPRPARLWSAHPRRPHPAPRQAGQADHGWRRDHRCDARGLPGLAPGHPWPASLWRGRSIRRPVLHQRSPGDLPARRARVRRLPRRLHEDPRGTQPRPEVAAEARGTGAGDRRVRRPRPVDHRRGRPRTGIDRYLVRARHQPGPRLRRSSPRRRAVPAVGQPPDHRRLQRRQHHRRPRRPRDRSLRHGLRGVHR